MSGGEPPLPPSRPPYHSWHGRPTYRRRGPSSSTRNSWIGRRPRSPPLPPPRPRHLRPSYKHRHVPQTPPSLSQSHHSNAYHQHGPPPPLSRTLQGRLRSPPRSPLRHSDLPMHRVDPQSYRGEPGPSHRVEPPEHLSFRGPDPPPFRPLPPKSRSDSFPFSSERPSLRGHSDHPPPYRGEPGPLYRADSVPHRDEFEPRRGLGGVGAGGGGDALSSRPDSSSQYAPWFRQPNKIHKTLKPKKRRPPPHIVGALRTSGPYMSKPQSPILSRIGLPVGERGTSGSRIGMGPNSGSIGKGPGPNLTSPKLSHDLSSTSSRSNTHDPQVFAPAKQRWPMSSPRPQQNLRSFSSPDERTNNDRQKLQPNGPVRVDSEKQEKTVPNGAEKRPRATAQRRMDSKSPKEEDRNEGAVCNGISSSRANGPSDTLAKKSSQVDVGPLGAISSAMESELASKEANGLKPEPLPKTEVRTEQAEAKVISETKVVSKIENEPSEAEKDTPESGDKCQPEPKSKTESPVLQARSSSPNTMETDGRPSDSEEKEERSTPEDQPSIPQKEDKPIESATKILSSGLQSEQTSSMSKPSKSLESAPKSQTGPQSEAVLPAGGKKEKLSAPLTLVIPEAPISVPAPAMSLLRSTPKARTRSSSFEGKLGSLNSFGPMSPSPPSLALDVEFLRGSATKTGVASNDLVRQIHEVEGKITAIERTIADLKNGSPRKVGALSSQSQPPKAETKAEESNADRYAALAREAAASAEARITGKPPKRSRHPLHAEARLLIVRNQAVAAASHAELRTFCSDIELGLDAIAGNVNCTGGEVSSELRAKVAEYLKRQRAEDNAKRRKLKKEYSTTMQLWRERLSAARERTTKEKRDALQERDRYILLCTMGTSALLTSRTSSGRTSTKIVPSVAANGQTNGTAELDQRLADIETEGGTPGSRLIWSKTLADIPAQDASRPPLDCMSVLMIDPVAEHHAARAVNPWRFEEVLVFLDKYLTCSKNFIKIASFLEHKSPRDCSYFYYVNKLRLGLKQLTKDASAMKRRGTLRRHLIQIAKEFAFLDPTGDTADSYHVSVQNAVAVSAAEKFMIPGDTRASGFLGMGSNRLSYMERREPRDLPFKRSERILNDVKAIDLSGIDRRPFAQAIAALGTDWKAIGSYLDVPGKSSTHYREFFRRNKRKLEAEDVREHSRARLLLPVRGPNSGARYSPRVSPRSSPRHSSHGNRAKSSDTLETESPELIQLDDTDNDDMATRIALKDDKESMEQRAKEEVSRPPKHEAEAASRATDKSVREVRKGKPTATWTAEECAQFRVLFKQHGRDWKTISRLMGPKTPTQIKGYWRTVAHEVGDGLTGDGTRSKAERKRMKRRTSSETFSRHSPTASQNDLRASPKVKCGAVGDDEEAMTEENGDDESRREDMNNADEDDSGRKKDVSTVVTKDGVTSAKWESGAQGSNRREIASSEERADVSKNRLPMLRSLPVPVRPSVGMSAKQSGKDSGNG